MEGGTAKTVDTKRRRVLWFVALILMLSSAVYQRRTGPSHELGGAFSVAGETHSYALIRSGETTDDARVAVPNPGGGTTGTLYYRRLNSNDSLTAVSLEVSGTELVGLLPAQLAAGKLQYHLVLNAPDGARRLPEAAGDHAVIRFHGPVPWFFLGPHIALMFFAVLVGLWTGLAALFLPEGTRKGAWVTVGGITLGGLVFGPIVQKYAFGEFWTGFPFGYDLTDNKTLIMWLVWVAAAIVIAVKREGHRATRTAVGLAAVVMLAVYLIPHSLRGSELDYRLLEEGVSPTEAVTTG